MIGRPGTRAVAVREVTAADVHRWATLRQKLWSDHTVEELSNDARDFFARGTPLIAAAFLAWHGNESIGFLELSVRPYVAGAASLPVPFVEGWFVDAGWRRQGVGRMLLQAAEDWARSRGYRQLGSDTNIENPLSTAAHAAAGFREVEIIRCFIKDI